MLVNGSSVGKVVRCDGGMTCQLVAEVPYTTDHNRPATQLNAGGVTACLLWPPRSDPARPFDVTLLLPCVSSRLRSKLRSSDGGGPCRRKVCRPLSARNRFLRLSHPTLYDTSDRSTGVRRDNDEDRMKSSSSSAKRSSSSSSKSGCNGRNRGRGRWESDSRNRRHCRTRGWCVFSLRSKRTALPLAPRKRMLAIHINMAHHVYERSGKT
jgi:hypothetical protein